MFKHSSEINKKPEIAVATVSGKAYYMIVDELERRNIPFLSLVPTEPIPIGIKVVLTTESEKHLVRNEKTLTYNEMTSPDMLINEALRVVQGKGQYEKMVIGVDPGQTIGVAVLTDGKVIETANCFGIEETQQKIVSILKNSANARVNSITVKVGDGVPTCEEKLLRFLDKALPKDVMLESVREAGTNHDLNDTKNRRGLRDIISAIKIAGRNGHVFQRSMTNESEN